MKTHYILRCLTYDGSRLAIVAKRLTKGEIMKVYQGMVPELRAECRLSVVNEQEIRLPHEKEQP